MYEWERELYFDLFAIFLAYNFVIWRQVEVLSFSLEAAWLRLMEAIYYPSILQKGSDEVTLNLWILLRSSQDDAVCSFFLLNYVSRGREKELFSKSKTSLCKPILLFSVWQGVWFLETFLILYWCVHLGKLLLLVTLR